jgi:hypothetical protein
MKAKISAGIAYPRRGFGTFLIVQRLAFMEDGMRSLTELVSEGFIWSIGITRPRPGKERVAAIYITAILAVTILGAASVFAFLLSRL